MVGIAYPPRRQGLYLVYKRYSPCQLGDYILPIPPFTLEAEESIEDDASFSSLNFHFSRSSTLTAKAPGNWWLEFSINRPIFKGELVSFREGILLLKPWIATEMFHSTGEPKGFLGREDLREDWGESPPGTRNRILLSFDHDLVGGSCLTEFSDKQRFRRYCRNIASWSQVNKETECGLVLCLHMFKGMVDTISSHTLFDGGEYKCGKPWWISLYREITVYLS